MAEEKVVTFKGKTSSDNPHSVVKGFDNLAGVKDERTGTLHTSGQSYSNAVDHASKCSGRPSTKKK